MAIKGVSVWHLDGDSTVGALTLDNGTVDFRPSTTTRLTPAFQAVSLSLGSLSGTPATFHEQRSLAERLYKQQGINTQKLLGHKSQLQTERYNDDRGKNWTSIII